MILYKTNQYFNRTGILAYKSGLNIRFVTCKLKKHKRMQKKGTKNIVIWITIFLVIRYKI